MLFSLLLCIGLSFFIKKRLFIFAKYANTENANLIAFNATGGAFIISFLFYMSVNFLSERISWIANSGVYPLIMWLYYVWFCWLIDDQRVLRGKKLFWSMVFGSITLVLDIVLIVFVLLYIFPYFYGYDYRI